MLKDWTTQMVCDADRTRITPEDSTRRMKRKPLKSWRVALD